MNEQNTSRVLVFRCLACDTPRTDQDEPCELCGAPDYLHVVEGEDLVTYTPNGLSTLIGNVITDAFGAWVRERAEYHRACAEVDHDRVRRDWHRGEADTLERLAARERADIEAGEGR